MTSAAPSGWRMGSGGGGATPSPTPPSPLTEVRGCAQNLYVVKPIQLFHLFPCNDADSCWSSWNNKKTSRTPKWLKNVLQAVPCNVSHVCLWPPTVFQFSCHLTIKALFLFVLHSPVFLHDFTAERGVFWSGGHRAGSPAGWPEGATRRFVTAKTKRQKFQRQHKAALLCEEACTSSCTSSSTSSCPQRGSV